MANMLGERKQRWRERRNRLAIFVLCCGVLIGCAGYLFSLGPEDGVDPMRIVQGTGEDMREFQAVYIGPSTLTVTWDEMIGQAWSIAYVSGWVRNTSNRPVSLKHLSYRVKDEDGTIIWEAPDNRFSGGFQLDPLDYIDFDVMPLCKRPAKTFELVIETE